MLVDNDMSKRSRTNYSEKSIKRHREDNEPTNSILSFKLFMETQDDDISEHVAVQRYNTYKDNSQKKHMKQFFESHKDEDWLKQLYHPAFIDQYREMLTENTNNMKNLYGTLLNHNCIDFSLSHENIKHIHTFMLKVSAICRTGNYQDISLISNDQLCEPTFVFLTCLSSRVSKADINELFCKETGFQRVEIRPPRFTDDWKVNVYLQFEPGTCVSKLICRINDGEFTIKGHTKMRAFKSVSTTDSVIIVDGPTWDRRVVVNDIKRATKMIGNYENIVGCDILKAVLPDDMSNLEVDDLLKILDKILLYLRLVHSYDYYGGVRHRQEYSFAQPMSVIHVRSCKDGVYSEDVINDWMDGMNKSELKVSGEEGVVLGVMSEGEEINKYMSENCHKVEEGKYLCTLSNKLFVSQDFVYKHIKRKYASNIERLCDYIKYFNNFVYDVDRPLPQLIVSYLGASPKRRKTRGCKNDRGGGKTYRYEGHGGKKKEYMDYDAPLNF